MTALLFVNGKGGIPRPWTRACTRHQSNEQRADIVNGFLQGIGTDTFLAEFDWTARPPPEDIFAAQRDTDADPVGEPGSTRRISGSANW